jgi:hypothetical protein
VKIARKCLGKSVFWDVMYNNSKLMSKIIAVGFLGPFGRNSSGIIAMRRLIPHLKVTLIPFCDQFAFTIATSTSPITLKLIPIWPIKGT